MMKILQRCTLIVALLLVAFVAQAQNGTRYHIVEEGQTLYAIARLYGIPVSTLQELNPGSGDLIRPGDKLHLPDNAAQAVANGPGAQFVGQTKATEQVPQTTKPNGTAQCKEMYQIQKKDNLYRVAMLFNLTIEELVSVNPPLTVKSKLKKGEWLCIPYSKAEIQAERNRLAKEKAETEAKARNRYKKHISLAVILPLKEKTDRGAKMVEFYQGLLMAVDSVRLQGTSVDVYAYHSGSGSGDLNAILQRNELKGMDLIFGPLDAAQAGTLSHFCQQHKIRLVMPFSTTNTQAQNNPYAYIVSPAADVLCQSGAKLCASHFGKYNFVFANLGAGDARGNAFTTQLSQKLGTQGISGKALNLDADDMAYTTAFSQFRDNVVVLNNSQQGPMQQMTRKLRNFQQQHPEYKISILGYPEWSTFSGSTIKDFYALNAQVYTSFFRNPTDARIALFEQHFRTHFKKDLIRTAPRYGMMGLDLGYFFLHGMATLGTYFDENVNTLTFHPLQNHFLFTQQAAGKAHVNTCAVLVHYTPEGNIRVIKQ